MTKSIPDLIAGLEERPGAIVDTSNYGTADDDRSETIIFGLASGAEEERDDSRAPDPRPEGVRDSGPARDASASTLTAGFLDLDRPDRLHLGDPVAGQWITSIMPLTTLPIARDAGGVGDDNSELRTDRDTNATALRDVQMETSEDGAAGPSPDFTPSDPLFDSQWHLFNPNAGQFDINVVDVWDDYTGAGVEITVIDTRVQFTHPDLDANMDLATDRDYVAGDSVPFVASTSELQGTAVLGLIGSEQGNGIGGVGVAYDATLRSYGGTDFVDIDDQIRDAAGQGNGIGNTFGNSNGADIVSMSLNVNVNALTNQLFNNDFSAGILPSIQAAELGLIAGTSSGRLGLGTVYVRASGNSRGNLGTETREEATADALDTSRYTIAVGSTRFDGWIDDTSTPGASLLVSAPTDDLNDQPALVTTDLTGSLGYNTAFGSAGDYASDFGGNYAAAPQVAGIVALMLEANPNLGWRDVQQILAYSARHVGSDVDAAANTGAPAGGANEQGTQANGATWFWNGAGNWNGGGLHFSNDYGFGLVDAKAAVRLAETWTLQQTSFNDFAFTQDMDGASGTTSHGTSFTTYSSFETTNRLLEYVTLNVDIVRLDDMNDMDIYLTSPSGTRVQMIADTGGAQAWQGNGFTSGQSDWSFGTAAFWGETSLGTWTVEMRNDDGPTFGLFQTSDVDLLFWGAPIDNDDVFVVTREFSDVAGVGGHATVFAGGAGEDVLNAAAVDGASTVDLGAGTGTIDGVAITLSGIETLFTGDGNDTITGGAVASDIHAGRGEDSVFGDTGAEDIFGGQGDDFLAGNAGADRLEGGDGNDTLRGDAGDDFLSGNDGDDTFVYLDGVTVAAGLEQIFGGEGTDRILIGNAGTYDFDFPSLAIASLEELEFATAAGETKTVIFTAKELDQTTEVPPNFRIDSNALGDDHLIVNIDSVNGLADLDASTWVIADWNAGDTIEINGDAAANEIRGTGAADTIDGGAGNDTLYGGVGDDTFVDTGLATIPGTVDTYVGGSGSDTVVHNTLQWSTTVTFNLFTGQQTVGANVGDIYSGIENLIVSGNARMTGSNVANTLVADDTFFAGNNVIDAMGGADSVVAGAGDDQIIDGDFLNGDIYDGGAGFDQIRWWSVTLSGATFDMALGTASNAGGTDFFTGFEFLAASNGSDIVLGSSGDETLSGEDGNDTIDGRGGNDRLFGGNGNDVFTADDDGGTTTIFGSAGIDLLDLSGSGVGWSVGPADAVAGSTTLAGVNASTGAEEIVGSDFADTIREGAMDSIDAGGGDDLVITDNIFALDETYFGGSGTDTIDLSASTIGRTLNLEIGFLSATAGGAFEFENAIGGSGADNIVGTTGANSISGGAGNDFIDGLNGSDTLDGADGSDTLVGGTGADLLYGGAGSDTADYSGSTAAVTVSLEAPFAGGGDAQGDELFGIENLVGSNFDDVLFGDAGSNTIDGGAGGDVLSGGGGSDVLYGGAGFDALSGVDGGAGAADTLFGGSQLDIAYYFTAGSSQVVDFADHANLANNSGEHTLDTWVSIEGFYGADAHANTIRGDAQDNLFLGGSQADALYGGDGSDVLIGRGGADLIYGGTGNDFISGDAGDDAIHGGAGEDTFYIFATSGIDRIRDYSETDDGFLFYKTGATQWSDLTFTVSGNDVHITRAGSSFTVIVEETTLADLDNSGGNFSFL